MFAKLMTGNINSRCDDNSLITFENDNRQSYYELWDYDTIMELNETSI